MRLRYIFPELDHRCAMDFLKLDEKHRNKWFTPPMSSVYALEMDNGTVKIGITNNLKNRIASIKAASGLLVLRSHKTAKVQITTARNIEHRCHETFAAFRTNGEFLKITFEDACAELDKYADFIAEDNRRLHEEIIPAKRKDYEDYIAKVYGSHNNRPAVKIIRIHQKTSDLAIAILFYENKLAFTTEQLAEFYCCSANQLEINFSNNKDTFVEGAHYFKLEGDELRAFKSQVTESNLPINKFASSLYLWTKRGAARHCKIQNTAKAWEMFGRLEDAYFDTAPKLQAPSDADRKLSLLKELFNSNIKDYRLREFANLIIS